MCVVWEVASAGVVGAVRLFERQVLRFVTGFVFIPEPTTVSGALGLPAVQAIIQSRLGRHTSAHSRSVCLSGLTLFDVMQQSIAASDVVYMVRGTGPLSSASHDLSATSSPMRQPETPTQVSETASRSRADKAAATQHQASMEDR